MHTDTTPTHGPIRPDLLLAALSVLSLASLAWPLITPLLSIAGAIPTYRAYTRQPTRRSTRWLITALILFAASGITALAIDTTLIDSETTPGIPHPVPPPNRN